MNEEKKLKETWKKDFIDYMFLKTNRMFKWENLPDTIPDYMIEKFLQEFGKCIFYKYEDEFYIFDFSFSNIPNVYNEPSGILFTNVALKLTVNEKRDLKNVTENGVIILNDNKIKGLKPIFDKYADLLTESEITIKLISQLDRMKTFISAGDERTKKDCENFLQKIKNGELSVIGDNTIFESVKSFNNGGVNTSISQYIELIQYLKAQCLNEIGINANYNLKRERLNNSEIQLNDFGLLPFCNLMLLQRQKAVEKINKKFNLDIKVSFSDIWEIEKITLAETLENEKNTDTAKELIEETENTDSMEIEENEQNKIDNFETDSGTKDSDIETEDSEIEKNNTETKNNDSEETEDSEIKDSDSEEKETEETETENNDSEETEDSEIKDSDSEEKETEETETETEETEETEEKEKK